MAYVHPEVVSEMRGESGELIDRLLAVLEQLPDLLLYDVGAYIALAIGGEPAEKQPRPEGRIPSAGTLAAAAFIRGDLVEPDVYRLLLVARLRRLVASEISEEFLVRAVVAEVTRRLRHLTDWRQANANRAEMLALLAAQGVEVSPEMRANLQPVAQREIDEHEAELRSWLEVTEPALGEPMLEEWVRRSSHLR